MESDRSDGERVFVLYDARACGGDLDDANVLTVSDDGEEAREDARDFGVCACFSFVRCGDELVDPRFEWNWVLGVGFSGGG